MTHVEAGNRFCSSSFIRASSLAKSTIANAAWQDSQGILKNDASTGGKNISTGYPCRYKQTVTDTVTRPGGEDGTGRLVRALSLVYALSSNDPGLQKYIQTFVAVQVGGQ
jgi:uncharacterized protein YgiB involved in biofilm formation